MMATELQHTPIKQSLDVKLAYEQTLANYLLLKCLVETKDHLSPLEFLVGEPEFHSVNCPFQEGRWCV